MEERGGYTEEPAAPDSRRFLRSEDVVTRRVAGEVVLVRVRAAAAELDHIFTLDEVGASIWEDLRVPSTLDELAERMASRYRVSPGEALVDAEEFVRDLVAERLVAGSG